MIRTLEKKVSDHNFPSVINETDIEAPSASGPVSRKSQKLTGPKAVLVCMQDRNFNSFAFNTIKLSVNEKN